MVLLALWHVAPGAAHAQSPPFAVVHTGLTTDLAINGEGWFVLRDPTSQQVHLESFGAFRLDYEGFLTSQAGERVQGVSTTTGEPVDVQLPWGNGRELLGHGFDSLGILTVTWSDGTQETPLCLLLARTPPTGNLEPCGLDRYAVNGAWTSGSPGSDGLGTIVPGALARKMPPAMPSRIGAPRPLAASEPPGLAINTGILTDLALRSKGFFLLRDPVTNHKLLTRVGAFKETRVVTGTHATTLITTYDGLRLQVRRNGVLADLDLAPEELTPPGSELLSWATLERGEVRSITHDTNCWIWELFVGTIPILDISRMEPLALVGLGRYELPDAFDPSAVELPAYAVKLQTGALEQGWLTPELCALREGMKFIQQGSILRTGRTLDLAVEGAGLFLLRQPSSGELFASRAGTFELDPQGYIVSQDQRFFPVVSGSPDQLPPLPCSQFEATVPGLRLQGYSGDPTLAPAQIGDLRIDPSLGSSLGTTLSNLWFVPDGIIQAVMTNGTRVTCGQVLLQRFAEPSHLARAMRADGVTTRIVYRVTPQSSPEPLATPGAVGFGKILSGCLELIPLDTHALVAVNPALRRLTLSGMPGTAYRIEATTDLRQWMVVGECLTDWYGKALAVSVDVADPNTPEALIPDAIWMGYRPSPLVGIPDLGPSAFYRIVR